MFIEGFEHSQDILDLCIIPTSYQFDVGINSSLASQWEEALKFDLGIRSQLSFDSSRNIALDFYSAPPLFSYNLKRPTVIKSFLLMANAYGSSNGDRGGVCYGQISEDRLSIKVPSKTNTNLNSTFSKVKVVDFYDNSLLIGDFIIDATSSTLSEIKFISTPETLAAGNYVKVINSTGIPISFTNHTIVLGSIYANCEFKPILEQNVIII